jgi:hypothetical protein
MISSHFIVFCFNASCNGPGFLALLLSALMIYFFDDSACLMPLSQDTELSSLPLIPVAPMLSASALLFHDCTFA